MTQATLYFKQGGSDKVYQAAIEEVDGGFLVNFAYGKRGYALRSGTKTANPVDNDKAIKIFNSLIKTKKSKGYCEGENTEPYESTDSLADARAAIRDSIEQITNFAGISGVFDMSPTDHLGMRPGSLAMIEIVNGKWTRAQ